jgi:hypothetical protein
LFDTNKKKITKNTNGFYGFYDRRSLGVEIAYDVCSLPMTQPAKDSEISEAVALLVHYSFEIEGYTAEELVENWRQTYPSSWLRLAVIEALYQGRYKGISVSQILAIWQRLGEPRSHFPPDFERLIVESLPRQWGRQATKSTPSKSKTAAPTTPSPSPKASTTTRQVGETLTFTEAVRSPNANLSEAFPKEKSQKNKEIRAKPAPPIQRFQPANVDSSFCKRLRHLTNEEENSQNSQNSPK